MAHQAAIEVFGPKQCVPVMVSHREQAHGPMTLVLQRYAEPYLARKTWNARQSLAQDSLNAFFPIDEASGRPLCFVDRDDSQRATKLACEALGATVTRRGRALLGYDVSPAVGARRLDDMLVFAEQFTDIAIDMGLGLVENPWRQKGFTPALEAQLRAARIRQAKQDNKEPDYRISSGRFFVVPAAGSSVPRTEDPHFHERTRQALVRFQAPAGVVAAWEFKEETWSRPVEAIEPPWASLHLGALAAGEDRFGRLAMLADKSRLTATATRRHAAALGNCTLAGELTKLTAMTVLGAGRLYGYLDGVRKDQDGGRGVAWYQDACRAGDEAAMRRPLFLNQRGGGLLYEAVRRRTFAPIMDLAGLKYAGKRPGMHLGRHDKITTAVERIMGLAVPDAVKDRMLDDLVEFVGWSTGRRMLAVYAASLTMINRARSRLRFVDAHAQPILAGPAPALGDDDPESLQDLFGNR